MQKPCTELGLEATIRERGRPRKGEKKQPVPFFPPSTIAGRNLTIASGNDIEFAFGGDGNDTITGNALSKRLHGGRGLEDIRKTQVESGHDDTMYRRLAA